MKNKKLFFKVIYFEEWLFLLEEKLKKCVKKIQIVDDIIITTIIKKVN